MGDSSSSLPQIRVPAEPPPPYDPIYVPPAPARRREPLIRFIVLLLLTGVSTYLVSGLSYSMSLLAILGAHEFGHYFACRYYRVDSSLPYFIPMPIFVTGTLGAVIRIRQPIPGKRAL